MLNFDILDEGLGIVSPAYFVCYILLIDQISLSGCVLQLFVNQVVTS